jgi:hypothetical protein
MGNQKTELRLDKTMLGYILVAAVIVIVGFNTGWFGFAEDKETPAIVPEGEGLVPQSIVPQIEKTSIYLSGFDFADFEGETQKNRVEVTYNLIKSGNVIETANTSTTTGAKSTAEFNGGDSFTVLMDSATVYAEVKEDVVLAETLQPVEIFVKAAATPSTSVLDDGKDVLAASITLDTNDVSKVHYLRVERPGDDNHYQFCGVGVDFDDDQVDIRLDDGTGSYVEGITDLADDFDALDTASVDAVWVYEGDEIKDFDTLDIAFVAGAAKDVNPGVQNITFTIFDCEKNLQNGEIVYTNEDAADSDIGITNIDLVVGIA